jgi:hypothetical protein
MGIHLKCPICDSSKGTGPHWFNVRGQCCTCGWRRDGFVEHFCQDASIIPALRAELHERAVALDTVVALARAMKKCLLSFGIGTAECPVPPYIGNQMNAVDTVCPDGPPPCTRCAGNEKAAAIEKEMREEASAREILRHGEWRKRKAELKAELLDRCTLTDPVVEAARAMRARCDYGGVPGKHCTMDMDTGGEGPCIAIEICNALRAMEPDPASEADPE